MNKLYGRNNWESIRDNTPNRVRKAIAVTALAGIVAFGLVSCESGNNNDYYEPTAPVGATPVTEVAPTEVATPTIEVTPTVKPTATSEQYVSRSEDRCAVAGLEHLLFTDKACEIGPPPLPGEN